MQNKDEKINLVDELLKGLEATHMYQLLNALINNKKLSEILKLLKTFHLQDHDILTKSGMIANLAMDLEDDADSNNKASIRSYINSKLSPAIEQNNNNTNRPPEPKSVPEPEKINVRPPFPADWQEFEISSGLNKKKEILLNIDQIRQIQISENKPFTWFFRLIFEYLNVAEQLLFSKKFPVNSEWLQFERRVLTRKKLTDAEQQAKLEEEDPIEKLTSEEQIEKLEHYISESEKANLPFIFSLRNIINNSRQLLTATQELDLIQTFNKEWKWFSFEKNLFSKEQQEIVDSHLCQLYSGKLGYNSFLEKLYRKKILSKDQKQLLATTFKDDRFVDYNDISKNNMVDNNSKRYRAEIPAEHKKPKKKKKAEEKKPTLSRKRKKTVKENNHQKDTHKKAKVTIDLDEDHQEIQNQESSKEKDSDAFMMANMMAKSMSSFLQSTAPTVTTPQTPTPNNGTIADADTDIVKSLWYFAQQAEEHAKKTPPAKQTNEVQVHASAQKSPIDNLLEEKTTLDAINQVEKNIQRHQKVIEEYRAKMSTL